MQITKFHQAILTAVETGALTAAAVYERLGFDASEDGLASDLEYASEAEAREAAEDFGLIDEAMTASVAREKLQKINDETLAAFRRNEY